jgi:hypothetical protein
VHHSNVLQHTTGHIQGSDSETAQLCFIPQQGKLSILPPFSLSSGKQRAEQAGSPIEREKEGPVGLLPEPHMTFTALFTGRLLHSIQSHT